MGLLRTHNGRYSLSTLTKGKELPTMRLLLAAIALSACEVNYLPACTDDCSQGSLGDISADGPSLGP